MLVPVLFVGAADRAEFRPILEQLREAGSAIAVDSVPEALAVSDRLASLELIIIAPAFRQQFPQTQLQHLFERQPLAEWWILVGPWLEGETRSGQPWPGVRRLYLDQALVELVRRQSLARAGAGRRTDWLPATLSAEERWLVPSAPWPKRGGCVRICSELEESRRSLAAVCRAAGLNVVSHSPAEDVEVSHVDAVIYDAVAARPSWREHIERLARPHPRSLIVLVNFPRPDETQWMLAAGATDVLGKPFRIDDLHTCIRKLDL
jgi:hypothetical protein